MFTDSYNSKQFLRYSMSKFETTTGSLWEAQIETAKKDYFTKNISSMVFEIKTSRLSENVH